MGRDRGGCTVLFPGVEVFEYAVWRLGREYPGDEIRWKGGGREQVEQAVAAARWASELLGAGSCLGRKLAAAAALFREVSMLHPLVDGNKRLSSLMLAAFLIRNGVPGPRPGSLYRAALMVAGGRWSVEDVYRWLLEEVRRRCGGGGSCRG